MWDPKKQIVQPLGFVMIPHRAVRNDFLQEMPFGFRGCPYDVGPQKTYCWTSGLCNNTPHGGEGSLFLKHLFFFLQEMPFGFRGVFKTWDPKKWILWPLGFAMIPTTTVSSLFFKTHYFSCRRCPLGSGGVHKTWDHRKQIVEPLGFAMIPHMAVRNHFF